MSSDAIIRNYHFVQFTKTLHTKLTTEINIKSTRHHSVFNACFDRFLMTIVNDTKVQCLDDILDVTTGFENATRKMAEELADKSIGMPVNNYKIISDVIKETSQKYSSFQSKEHLTIKIKKHSIMCNEIKIDRTSRINYLLKKFDKLDVISMLLRYEAIMYGYNHMSMDIDTFEKWLKPYLPEGPLNEAMASPLNAIVLTMNTPGVFCSLFYDTDKPFGSIGSFLNPTLSLDDYEGGWFANISPIQSLMDKSAERIIELLHSSKKSHVFIVTMINWTDCLAYELLSGTPFLKEKVVIPAEDVKFYNSKEERLVHRREPIFMFVLAKT